MIYGAFFGNNNLFVKVTILGLVSDQVHGDNISIGDVGVAANMFR
jgi:hypothetical protein